MRALLVATSATPSNAAHEIAQGRRQRLDYLELSQRMDIPYTDYNALQQGRSPLRMFENVLRLDLVQALYVAQKVRREQFNIVFSLSERVGIPLTYLLPRNVRHIVQVHHLLSPKKLSFLKALRIPYHWDMMTVYTHAEARSLQHALNLDSRYVRHIQHPVDTQFYKPGASYASTATPHIMSVGLSYRDYPTLVDALCTLPHVQSYVYAASSWVQSKDGVNRELLPKNINIKPYVQPAALRERYYEARFVVTPICNTTQWSAGVNSVLEAQAMGKAIVATRTPGMTDYIRDGETGILIEPGDSNALANAIDYLWKNPDIASTMGRRGRAWVEATFSLDLWLHKYVEILNDMACERAQAIA
jgi:glycosyltransferase involved in cell wall biosynthesis